ncbi:MAG: hypothetical protein IT458_09220 [Planctomycetes bacterium]|nr:hypothetical protein [Planctomycetota bacterium]
MHAVVWTVATLCTLGVAALLLSEGAPGEELLPVDLHAPAEPLLSQEVTRLPVPDPWPDVVPAAPGGAVPGHPAAARAAAAALAPHLRVALSPRAAAMLPDTLATVLEPELPELRLAVEIDSDRAAIERVILGRADTALVVAELTPFEVQNGLRERTIAERVLVLVPHPRLSVRTLTARQVRELLTGSLDTWTSLGGGDARVRILVSRGALPPTQHSLPFLLGDRLTNAAVLLPDDRACLADLRTPGDLAVVALDALEAHAELRPLAIDGVIPHLATYQRGEYPYGFTLRLVHGPQPGSDTRVVEQALLRRAPAWRR